MVLLVLHFLDHVCRLHKSNYGLKQAPQAWFDCFASHLQALGFQVFNPLMLIPKMFIISDGLSLTV